MSGTRSRSGRARTAVAALSNLLILGLAGCGEIADEAPAEPGRGPLVSPAAEITACEPAIYEGARTLLYSNRPYHTTQDVAPALGLTFCRGERHGTNVWRLEIERPTTLIVFGRDGDGLASRGWTPMDAPLEVAAAGRVLDRIYRRDFAAGRYVIRQGFHATAPIVLWNARAARPAP